MLADLRDLFPFLDHSAYADLFNDRPKYNIPPGSDILAVLHNAKEASPKMSPVHWGLIPRWSRDKGIANKLINARSETLAEKPSFRSALQKRRCLIPADGFYEWKRNPDGTKTPMYIRMKSGKPFAFAGLWESWLDPETSQEILSTTVITTVANELMKPIHDRMPVIISPEHFGQWLSDQPMEASQLQQFFLPTDAQLMQAYAVGPFVNRPGNDLAECIDEVKVEPGDTKQTASKRPTSPMTGSLFPDVPPSQLPRTKRSGNNGR